MKGGALASPCERRAVRKSGPSEGLLYALLGLMVWFWSLNFIIGKIALRDFPPLLLGGLRAALAGVLIWPIYVWKRLRTADPAPAWTRRDVPLLLFLGLCGVSLNQLFFMLGLSRTSVAHAAIIIGTTPIQVLVIAAAMGLERVTRAKVIGMTVALAGVAVLNLSPYKGSGATLAGDLLIFLGALAFAIFTVFGKRATVSHETLTVSTFAYVGGGLILAPVTLWESASFSYRHVTPAGWASLFYMAAFSSVLCYLIFYYALTYIPASRVSAFSYLQPLIATVLAIPLLGETVTGPLMLGGALVFSGVYVAERG